MRRVGIRPRDNLAERAHATGFTLHAANGGPYWDESAFYEFSLQEIERDLEGPTQELATLCLELVERVVADEKTLKRLRIPPHGWDIIRDSWRRGDQTLYGRFDLAYDGSGPARLLEYNADTPTALFEAAVFQWLWLEDLIAQGALPKSADQFNSLHEKLIARLADIRAATGERKLHLACMPVTEDKEFLSYLEDCATQAGFSTQTLDIADIGRKGNGPFVDLRDRPIRLLFKLYPWEWMFADAFGHTDSMAKTRFIEPPWKAVLSSKGILPLLWEMAPGHANLLPAFFEDDPECGKAGRRYARKPLYSREGRNVTLVDGERVIDADGGPYVTSGFVRQAMGELRAFDGNFPVIGSWIVGGSPCGIGIREDISPITKNTSRFVPHAVMP